MGKKQSLVCCARWCILSLFCVVLFIPESWFLCEILSSTIEKSRNNQTLMVSSTIAVQSENIFYSFVLCSSPSVPAETYICPVHSALGWWLCTLHLLTVVVGFVPLQINSAVTCNLTNDHLKMNAENHYCCPFKLFNLEDTGSVFYKRLTSLSFPSGWSSSDALCFLIVVVTR